MDERFREPEGGLAWRDPVLVVCPRCAQRAVVRETGRSAARLTCSHCALSRESADQPARPVDGTEPRFGVPLWLRAECCGGHLLWASNTSHLDYLESYIGARLRERPPMPSGLSWYLPGWMKRAGHRDEVLRTIGRMRATLG